MRPPHALHRLDKRITHHLLLVLDTQLLLVQAEPPLAQLRELLVVVVDLDGLRGRRDVSL